MAPRAIEQQTLDIISCLFNDDSALDGCGGDIEADCPSDDGDTFDPSLIAAKLRKIGDDLYNERELQPLMRTLEQAAAEQGNIGEAFGQIVETLCQAHVAQSSEVAPEMQLLRASVSLCQYAKRSSPAVRRKVATAMGAFVNIRLMDWLRQQGGWDQVSL